MTKPEAGPTPEPPSKELTQLPQKQIKNIRMQALDSDFITAILHCEV